MKHLFVNSVRYTLLWIGILPLALSACLDENVSCVTDAFDTVRVNFLKLDRANARNDTLYFESIQASNGDFLDIQNTALRSIALPLNPSGNQVIYYVNWREDSAAELQTDTLIFDYNREQRLISPECGVEQRFIDLRSSNMAFDSLLIVDPEITLLTNPNVNIYTCQYEYTHIVRARFYSLNTTDNSTDEDTLVVSSITDDLGNLILSQQDTLHRVLLPVDTTRNTTTFFFEIENETGEIVNRELNVSYFVDTVQFFHCQPQIRVRNLDVNASDHNFTDVEVDQEELNINNIRNLEIFF